MAAGVFVSNDPLPLQACFIYRTTISIHQCDYKANSEQEVGQQRTLAVQAKVQDIKVGASQLDELRRISHWDQLKDVS